MPSILEVKLGRPLQMPKKRLEALLLAVQHDCCRARNAAMTHWYTWWQQHTDWKPGDSYEGRKKKIKRKKKPNPAGGKKKKDSPIGPPALMDLELYDRASDAAPNVARNVLSACCKDVRSRLKSKTPYNHEGSADYVWQAIIGSEVSLPTWRLSNGTIPAPNQSTSLGYDGEVLPNRPNQAEMMRAAKSGAAIRFALLSRTSGYRNVSPIVRLEVGDLSKGRKRILRKLVSGEWKLADSTIKSKGGKWFVQLCYDPPKNSVDCSEDRVLVLVPSLPGSKWPFELRWENDEGELRRWGIGNGKPLVAEFRRVSDRRRVIRYRYKHGGLGKGHGRKGFYKALKPTSRKVKDMQARFEKQTVHDIVAKAIREGCGAILYREPTMPVRSRSWFESFRMPFAWAEFQARLKFKAVQEGLKYEVKRIGMGEWKPKEDGDKKDAV